jgi:hypothetical protein
MRINDPHLSDQTPKRKPNSPSHNLVVDAFPMREARRPLECTGKSPCWVLDGGRSLDPNTGLAARCAACGGKIRP